MTERSGGGLPVATIAGALFCVVLIYLALQVRAGEDPAIGAGKTAGAAPRPVVVRRVIVRRIVEQPVPDAGTGVAAASPGSAPVASSAPAAAPVAVAPAPAPAPAPVVSGGS